MTFELPNLPFDKSALEPYISAKTLEFHHGKHHAAYVNNLNNLVKDTPFALMTLEEIILKTANDPAKAGIFNNAAQVFNHTFFWNCMQKNGGGEVPAEIAKAFGGADKFKEEFKAAATSQFGSGWAWLVKDKTGALKIVKTGNATNPLTSDQVPLLTVDVWEHAYYLDYQNRRPDFVDAFLNHLVNWNFVLKAL